MGVVRFLRRKAGVRHANHKATGIHGRAHARDRVFHGDAHGGIHAQRTCCHLIDVAMRFAAPNSHIFVPRTADRDQIGEPSGRQ